MKWKCNMHSFPSREIYYKSKSMKPVLLLAAGLLLCTYGFSQNVGIGTANPVFKLDVRNGSINTDSVYRIGGSTILSVRNTSNLLIGHQVGLSVTGTDNTFTGYQAGNLITTGSDNCFYGSGTGYFTTTTGSNSFFGAFAGYLNTSSFNSFFGTSAGMNNNTGFDNSFFGVQAGSSNTAGYDNSFFGKFSGGSNSTGTENSFIGWAAGYYNTTGRGNTALGYNAGVSTGALFNATAIGAGATVNANNKIRLGNGGVTVIEGQVPYTFPSDGRFKTNVTETVIGLDFIMKLRPVIYNFQAEKMDAFISGKTVADVQFASHHYAEGEVIRQSGFIAQEVEKAAKETGYDFNGVVIPKNEKGTYSLAYSQFVVPLVKAVQELQATIEQQNIIAEHQNRKIEMLLKEITLIKAKMK